MKKILAIIALTIIALSTLTACGERAAPFTGEVVVTELDHVPFRPKVGSMPMRSSKWQVRTCEVMNSESCTTKRIRSGEYKKLTVGQVLHMENNKLIIPQ